MDAREQRLAQNEALFREINEKVEAIAAVHGSDDHVYEFYCECSNADCSFQVPATIAAYEAVRAHPRHFIVTPEHWLPEIETIAEEGRHLVGDREARRGRRVRRAPRSAQPLGLRLDREVAGDRAAAGELS